MKRRMIYGAVFLVFSVLLVSQFIISANKNMFDPTNDILQARKRKNEPISIDGDADFARQANRNGWPGSGTSTDPYIIENYDLEIPYKKGKKSIPSTAISISNTTVDFVIRYCTLYNYNGDVDGIVLWNVINGHIYDNFIVNFVNGIFLVGSDYITITNNNIQGYSEIASINPTSQNIRLKVNKIQAFISRGVFLDPSNHNEITNNVISGCTGSGVELLDSSDNHIAGNTIDNSVGENGIFLAGSDYNSIADNDIYDSGAITQSNPSLQGIKFKVDRVQAFISRGVFLDPSNYNFITNNKISGYTGTGVELLDSSNNLIDSNMIDNNAGENGVFLAGSDYNNITDNDIYDSGVATSVNPSPQSIRLKMDGTQAFISRGVFLDPSNHNVITNNRISGYTGTGVELLGSSDNLIDGNMIDNSAGENGVFLAGSDYNNITDNDIYDSGVATSVNPSPQSIRLKMDGTQAFISRGVFLDPSNHNVITNNRISGYTGTGVELLGSSDNLIDGNMIDNSAGENGVFLAGSDYNNITDNDIYDSGVATSVNPSLQSIRLKMDGTQAFISRGVFLDPSNHNVITNNRISGYTGTGVELLGSSDNLIDGNMIDNSVGENGVFLAESNYNTITNNDVWGCYDDTLLETTSQKIKYKVDGTQAFISRGVFLDPSNYNVIANNKISNITGLGLYLLNSINNSVVENQIANNAEDGILLFGSNNSDISHNVIYNDDLYGISISYASTYNNIDWNDFIGNNIGGTSQINDDGSGNQFSNNFLVDHDNTDNNNDSISDNPYYIDGDAGSTDYSPYSLPVQPLKDLDLALADLDAEVDYESETLNLKNEGNWETVKIKLPEGYSATNINVSSIYTDGMIYAEEAQVQNPRTLTVKFNRTALIIYLESILTIFPIDVKMNVTGWLNGEFLMFYGYDFVKVLNSDSADPALIIDQEIEKLNNNPAQKFIDHVIMPTVAIPTQILIDQITSISQRTFGLTIGILFAPMITAVVIRRFHSKKKV